MSTTTTTPAQQHADQVAMLQVFTTEQTAGDGQETVVARTRSTEKNPVAEANRLRCIVIPELRVNDIASKYHSRIMAALRQDASKQLDSLWKATPSLREVPAAIWSVDSLLLFAARETESKRLTSDNLAAWFEASDLAKRIAARPEHDDLMAEWLERIQKFAAPTLDLNADECALVMRTMAKEPGVEDGDNLIAKQVLTRATKRHEAMTAALNRKLSEV